MTHHPDIYHDPRGYDLFFEPLAQGDDLAFYAGQAQAAGGDVLELACGTGRLTIPLAEQGLAMTGLDVSPLMLAEARRKADERGITVAWVEADCRHFGLGRLFSLIFLPANSLTHLLDRPSVEDCLACVRRHLAPGGRFVLDFFNPALEMLTPNDGGREMLRQYDHPDRGRVTVWQTTAYDRASQINRIHWYSQAEGEADETDAELTMRIFYPQELDALLHYNGFVVEAKYGGFDRAPFASDSRRQLAVCRAAPGRL